MALLAAMVCAAVAVEVRAQGAASPPQSQLYLNTSLRACPGSEQLAYFFSGEDTPVLRAPSWCGAAQAAVDQANQVDTVRWRIPYQLVACTPGVGWTYAHRTLEGGRFLSAPLRGIHLLCQKQPAPPLGCALGGGGFAACGGDSSYAVGLAGPDAPLRPGTPAGGGPSADAGAPGEDAEGVAGADDAAGAEAAGGADPGDSPSGGGICRASAPPAEAAGNPVFAGNGNKYQREHDLDGPPGLRLVRHYNSSLPGWVHNHGMRVLASARQAMVVRPDGRALRFSPAGLASEGASPVTGEWSAGPGVGGRLWRLPAADGAESPAWRFIDDADRQEEFDAQGRLLRVAYRAGPVITARWGAEGLLQSVNDSFGRSLRFGYDGAGRLTQASGVDGATLHYGYDEAGRLSRVQLPDGHARHYLYEEAAYPQALTGLVDERGQRAATWRYDDQGRAISSEHAGGMQRHTIEFAGDGAWPIARITDPLGGSRVQQYQRVGQRLRLAGQSAACAGCQGDVARREVDAASGLAVAVDDYLGVRQTTTWDAARRLPLATVRAAGRPEARVSQTEWHPQWRLPVRRVESGGDGDAATRVTEWRYDEAGRLLALRVQASGSGSSDEGSSAAASVLVREWRWAYDAHGLRASHSDPLGRTWLFAHDRWGQQAALTDPLGQVTRFTRDVAGRLLARTDPDGIETRWTYGLRGQITRVERVGGGKGGVGAVPATAGVAEAAIRELTELTYTPTGRLASLQLPSGEQRFFDYDPADRLVAVRDGRGAFWAYERDAAGQPLRWWLRDTQGRTQGMQWQRYGAVGQVAERVDASGHGVSFAYDANGLPIAQADPAGGTTRLARDALGRIASITWADQSRAELGWLALGTAQLPGAPGAAGVWEGAEALASLTDPRSVATRYLRNAFGEVVAESSPDIGTLHHTRDAAGQRVAFDDARGLRTPIERDALGRPTRLRHPDGQETQLAYDAGGRLLSLEDSSGGTRWQRDALGRVIARRQRVDDHPRHPRQLTLGYAWGPGGLASVTYPSGLQVAYRREGARVVALEVRRPGRSQALAPWLTELVHTPMGQPVSWRWPGGDAAWRQLDASGRVVATEFARYRHDAAGRLIAIEQDLVAADAARLPVTWEAGYDSRHRLTYFAGPGGESRYRYDANGNRTRLTQTALAHSDAHSPSHSHSHSHSQSHPHPQPASSPGRDAIERDYLIDPASNRLLGFDQSLAHGRARQTAQVRFILDAGGALTSDGLRRVTHDAGGRIAQVRWPEAGGLLKMTFLTNALGQRVFKQEPRVVRRGHTPHHGVDDEAEEGDEDQERDRAPLRWLRQLLGQWFGGGFGPGDSRRAVSARTGTAFLSGEPEGPLPAWALLGEYDGGSRHGRGDTEYLWLPTEGGGAIPVGLYRRGRLYAIHADALGTPRQVKDDEGRLLWQWPYSGFGEAAPIGPLRREATSAVERAHPPLEMNLRFPGQYADEETGWIHNHWRTYAAREGRYLQPDPIGLASGWNRYGYAEGDALSGQDPWGLDATRWWPGPHRSLFDGPRNGNWGGKHWSGGVGGGQIGSAPPTDSADACYMRHDLCYQAGTDKSQCDGQLVKELRDLPDDVRMWSQPPRPGTETDTRNYRSGALWWFD